MVILAGEMAVSVYLSLVVTDISLADSAICIVYVYLWTVYEFFSSRPVIYSSKFLYE